MRVAVLLGGRSPERSVSLSSGGGVAQALRALGHEAVEIDPADPSWIKALMDAPPHAVLNLLHGEWGEDGRVQGVLDYLGIPYSHSGVLASALAMDKAKTKAVLREAGLPLADGRLINRHDLAAGHPMAPPYVVKPNAQGSSVGVFIVREGDNGAPQELLAPDWAYGDDVLVEQFVAGKELTVAVLGEAAGPRALAVTEIVPTTQWYDFEAKYAEGGSRHELPASLPNEVTQACMRAAEKAHLALSCRGVTRTDFRYDPATGKLAILELNTQPGMTPTSLAPEQAAYCGMTYQELVAWMLEDCSCPR